MYRIRFHGRGGQGMKTASRVLGRAFFRAGFEVQDAPRYGAERRGAPIFAYVRADRRPIHERGVITRPDLVIVADDSLMGVPAAGVLQGLDAHTVLLIDTPEPTEVWSHRLNLAGPVIVLSAAEEESDRAQLTYVGSACAGAAARLVGQIDEACLRQAVEEELGTLGEYIVQENLAAALAAYRAMAAEEGRVQEGGGSDPRNYVSPDWIDLPFESARRSAPTIHAALTSVEVRTGLWRTMRPVIDYDRCSRCWWVCSTFCPDGAIDVDETGVPAIDYDHCKGCLVCMAKCPPHAIEAIAEHLARERESTPS